MSNISVPIDEFNEFLIKHKANVKFNNNLRNLSGWTDLADYCQNEDVVRNNVISSAFIWSKSPEKREYWNDLSLAWQLYMFPDRMIWDVK